jgi:hypothetical protein
MKIRGRVRWKRLLLYTCGALAAILLVIQAVPYGRDHTNPPVLREPAWNSAQTRAYAVNACYDCHSNETKWPWYTNIAPVSLLTQSDVEDGRSVLNFSEWNRPQGEGADEIAEVIRDGAMPPFSYAWMPNHRGARLSDSEKAAFIRGLEATLRASPPIGGSD